MVTFAQAQERAEEWINGDVPAYLHREVKVREFGLGFVVWAEDREAAPTPDAGRQRLVIARDSGEATLWPGLPVGEVIRRYEEEYGAVAEAAAPAAAQAAPRIDLNQTSFLLTPPEWLQEAADKIGLPPVGTGSNASQASGDASAESASATPASGLPTAREEVPGREEAPGPVAVADAPAVAGGAEDVVPGAVSDDAAGAGAGAGDAPAAPWEVPAAPEEPAQVPGPVPAGQGSVGGATAVLKAAMPPQDAPGNEAVDAVAEVADVSAVAGASAEESAAPWAAPVDGPPVDRPADRPAAAAQSPWADANASSGGVDGAVPLPATVFAPPLSGADDEDAPAPSVGADAPTALMKGGSALPPTAIAPRLNPDGTFGRKAPEAAQPPSSPATPATPATPEVPAPPAAPPAGGYVRTQLVSQLPDGPPAPPGPPAQPGAPVPPPPPPGVPGGGTTPAGGVAHAATMLARPEQAGPGVPPPPPPPGVPGGGTTPAGGVAHAATMLARPPQGGPAAPPPPPPPPGVPGAGSGAGTPAGGIAHAATMLAHPGPGGPGAAGGPAGPPPPPGPAPAPSYGYPQPQPTGLPTVGPGYQAVLRYRAPDGSEQQLIRRSAPGTPHPEWQILHELRAMNVPPQQVLELHTELESCELPGGYCARMIRETWPQARITNIAPYGRDHAGRQQGMRQLLTHQGELHQVADGPARPAPVRAPLPQVQPAPPLPPDGVAQELAGAFGPGILRFDQRAVSRQGVPELVAVTLMWAGLPADFGPFFWAQPAMPVVPTLAELAAQRQVQAAPDAGSYLVLGSDFGRAVCVQYGTAHIVAVPVEAGPGGQSVPPQFVNTGLPEFVRSLALLGRMWRLRFGLNPEQAGRWTTDFQAQLAMLDPAALASPENWWSVLLEQMWDGLL
ncbi:SUKH-4 family immunity protein [Streptomyces sp. NPDC090025]|uniref:SUKH-4 family immunity protein n=1 Tax=Streptomyces sp. NPDC090025 TaxID=3365922 RepID=UPI003834B35F